MLISVIRIGDSSIVWKKSELFRSDQRRCNPVSAINACDEIVAAHTVHDACGPLIVSVMHWSAVHSSVHATHSERISAFHAWMSNNAWIT